MKKIIFSLLFILAGIASFGQQSQGLQNILVEEIIPTAAAISLDPKLANAKTYRVFVDLVPGWKLKVVEGSIFNPLIFNTSTNFYNDENKGATYPTTGDFRPHPTVDQPLYYDSWITIGGIGDATRATSFSKLVPLTLDTWAPINDGFALGQNPEGTTDKDPGNTFDAHFGYAGGMSFTSNNTLYYNASGVTGATTENFVCIGQFTTTGAFNFEMPIQIGNADGSAVEKLVFRQTESGIDKLSNLLRWPVPVNQKPTVSITAPANNASFNKGVVVTVNANAIDTDGTISRVDFTLPNGQVVSDNMAPYSTTFPAVSAGIIRAVSYDNLGLASDQATVSITVTDPCPTQITFAGPGSSISLSPVTLSATVADCDETPTAVVFIVDGGTPIAATLNAGVYSATWNPTAGNHSIAARATVSGNNVLSLAVNVIVTNALPSITLAPASFSLVSGNDTTFVATVSDTDGTISKVDFTIDGNTVTDAVAPFEFTYVATSSGSKTLQAVVTDNANGTASASVNFSVAAPSGKDYELGVLSVFCSEPDIFCLPIKAAKTVANVTGYDVTLIFDKAKVTPTGIINVNEGAAAFIADRDWASYSVNTYPGTDSIKFSIYLNTTAPANTFFAGDMGDVLACVEFSRMSNFGSQSTAAFSTRVLQESKLTGYVMNGATAGSYSTKKEKDFAGSLSFWSDNSPIAYTLNTNLITNISGDKTSVKVQPNVSGNFIYDITNGTKMTISRDIPNDVRMDTIMKVIGGLDAYYTARVTVDDAGYKPNVYQLIAMDVNRDGRVTAGDITQMQQRSVLNIGEYTQAGGTNLDWVFVPSKTVLEDVSYRISPNYPYVGSYGYFKNAVPAVPVAKDLVALQTIEYTVFNNDTCTSIKTENYKGILLGDVTGNYASMPASPRLKSGKADVAKFVIDLRNLGNNEYEVLISTENADVIKGYDINFECSKFVEIVGATDFAKMNMARNLVNSQVGVTGYSLGNFRNGTLASIVLKSTNDVIASDIKVNLSNINENPVNFELKETLSPTGIEDLNEGEVSIYPNPASDILTIAVIEKSTIQLLDVNGKVVMETAAEAGEVKELDIRNLSDGVYLVKIVSDKKSVSKKVFVQK